MFLDGVAPYALSPDEKEAYLRPRLEELIEHHRSHCAPYARLVDDWRLERTGAPGVEGYPFLPATVFKLYELKSTQEEVLRLSSSATSGAASTIFVDRPTKKRQSISAQKVLADFIGPQQRPYIVFDLESTVRGSNAMGARGAAILSLAHFASEFHFVAREDGGGLRVDRAALERAVEAVGDREFIAYGFTYILYQAHEELAGSGFSAPGAHPNSVLLHSGGWKRLADRAVDKASFNRLVAGVWGLGPERVVDFYGAVEQVGIPYPDCCEGLKHVPYWAEIVVRRNDSLAPAAEGETGLLQLLSCLPLGAPNHSVLTEDLAELALNDGCRCGRRGRAFRFQGRAPRAEIRGCSDVART